jgi:predicted anti-sigma-YlaC factor YlaD
MSCRDFAGALEALLDGTLEGEARERSVRHVASCPSCRELVEPMGAMLVSVAVQPPVSFLAAVLARTSYETRRSRWAETWHQWMLRPRFASEAAYVGVVLLSLSFVTLDRSGVLNDLRSEAGILLDRATSLWEKETP